MVSGWIEQTYLDEGQGGTAALTIGCPDDFYAVRLGFANVTHAPWTLAKVIGAASDGYGDYVHPTGAATWTPFTFAMAGADDDRIVTRADAPTTITVAPTEADPATGHDDEPRWTWTDWTPLASRGVDPETGMRVLMLRALVPPRQTICHAVGQLRTLLGNRALNKGFEIFIGGIKFDRDRVTDPSALAGEPTTTWIDNQLAAGSLFPMVQFLTPNAGIMGTGDSHQQGTSTTEEFTGFLYRAMTKFGHENIGEVPAGMVNCAVGGLTSDRFFARLATLLPSVRPSFVVLPGWTYNDATGGVHADRSAIHSFMARLLCAIELCGVQDCVPICLTPFPRDPESMTSTQIEPWHLTRQKILDQIGQQTSILDAATILGARDERGLTGFYQEAMTNEHRHPSDAGHQFLGEQLKALVTQSAKVTRDRGR